MRLRDQVEFAWEHHILLHQKNKGSPPECKEGISKCHLRHSGGSQCIAVSTATNKKRKLYTETRTAELRFIVLNSLPQKKYTVYPSRLINAWIAFDRMEKCLLW